MKILIACEYSGVVRDSFLRAGHEALSCDLLPSETEGPHYQGDLFNVTHEDWDLIIAHPPCTYLSVTANKWLKDQPPRKSGALVGAERRAAVKEASDFFMRITELPAPRLCIENPVGVMSTLYRKPDQIIQPHHFGHPEPKKTCLWLRNLPKLLPTNIVEPEYHLTRSGKRVPRWFFYADKSGGQDQRAKIRSRTFQGIADAMVEQWG